MISSSIAQFKYYKQLADKAMAQISENDMKNQINRDDNSISVIIRHMSGNMKSRWTNIFEEDGEKPWRQRDAEFENSDETKDELLEIWESGWNVLFETLNSLSESDLARIIYIRNEGMSVGDAILRQLCHYSYHCGQIVSKSKLLKGGDWVSLSIPKNGSETYNESKFIKRRVEKHFLDDLLDH